MSLELLNFDNQHGDELHGMFNPQAIEYGLKTCILYLHGFERSTTNEVKFRKIVEAVGDRYSHFRYDSTGTGGLSEGDFINTTVESLTSDLASAYEFMKRAKHIEEFIVVAHSLSACVVAEFLETNPEAFSKIVLIAPATNQAKLHRFWFTKSAIAKTDPNLEITWSNYSKHLDEEKFQEHCKIEMRQMKAHYISNQYFLEVEDQDWSAKVAKHRDRILHIHGGSDKDVPVESITEKLGELVLVPDANHDVEKPKNVELWLPEVKEFLKK